MTLTQGQGHRVNLKMWKNEYLLISRRLFTVEVWKLHWKVVCNKIFQSMQMKMILGQGQGHRVNLKCWKNEHLPISQRLLTIELWKLDWKVVCDKTFQSMQVKVTLGQGQGHRVILKCWNFEHLPISQRLLPVQLWNLIQGQYVPTPSKAYKWRWPWPKVKVTVKVKSIADTWVIVALPF